MSDAVFIDIETTGLNPDQHQIWEVSLVIGDDPRDQFTWQLPVDLGRADPKALEVGGFYNRRWSCGGLASLRSFSEKFERLTGGKHLVGAVVSFDEERLRKALKANGAAPGWHYHLIDVEALAVGYLYGKGFDYPTTLPWDSELLSRWVDVDPNQFDRHTALGDALWAKAIYEAVTNDQP